MGRFELRSISLAVLGLAVALPGASRAQEAIEEIVITAQRRERSLQETPISITAFSEADLEERGIENALQLTDFVPNVNIQLNANGSGLFVSSRGIGQADATLITREPAVAMYIDGVYWGMTNGNVLDVLDLERIEVLRGPQGDLYGRNTSAGAVNFITRKPSGSYGTKASVQYGRFDETKVRIYQEFPILGGEGEKVPDSFGTLSGSMSFYVGHRDPYYDNAFDAEIDGRERYALRGALRYEREAFEALASVDYSFANEQGPEMELTQTYPTTSGAGAAAKAAMDPFLRFGRDHQLDISGSRGGIYANDAAGTMFLPAPGSSRTRPRTWG